ncbi:DUF3048 domain-containing protein [Nocardioides plantarum]|uniref:DUF3048 domain-containing protein n=1 Tax=Nocardioides plantarum TaxID=29299 RepID=A0ABV5K9I0_9ACTN|nr:DUF3048 domain-containing protein [Nocardioides plantarum]
MLVLRAPDRGAVGAAATLAAGLVAVLALAGCGGSPSKPATTAEPDDEATVAGAPRDEVSGDPDTWPLTGLPVTRGASVRKHPVLVAKVDNTSQSAPQLGLSAADLVVEEMVEGGVTRLAAFYYSTIPDDVGPLRSMRASDIGIVTPVGATMVTSGAATVTIARLRDADVPFYEEGAAGFARDRSRPAPYNLFADLDTVADEARSTPARPPDYLPFSGSDTLRGGQAATSVQARFSTSHTTTWSYADGGYRNDDGLAADGDEFPADTVLVLRVEVGDAGYRDPAGNPVPETTLVGDGEALLFHGGRVVRGTWTKKALDAPLRLRTKAGALGVPRGHTWIELVPAVGGDVTFD